MALKKLWASLTTRRLLVALLFLGIFGRALREANDPDMWWHLATGRAIVTQQEIPKADPFSYTRAGTRWYTHEWLTEVGMFTLYQWGGKAALIFMAALLITLTFWWVYLQSAARPHVAVFLVLAGAFASSVSWGVRPQILTMAGLALFSWLLERYRQGARWPLWLFPALTVLWTNLHAGFLLGPAFLALNLAGDALALWFKRTGPRTLTWARWRALALATLATLPAAFLNPNGWTMLRYPFDTLTSSAMRSYIQEWASPNFHDPGLWPFAVVLLGGMAIFAMGRRRLELTDLLTFWGFAAAGLFSARHIPLFAVLAPPIISRAIVWDSARIQSVTTRLFLAINWSLLLVAVLVVGWQFQRVMVQDRQQEAAQYPQAAVAYLRTQGWETRRVFNTYNWGGYLIWEGLPVFIDGRADVYGDAFMLEYLTTYHLTPNWRRPLDKYKVDYVLIESRSPLATLLLEAPEWDQAYQDEVATIFVQERWR